MDITVAIVQLRGLTNLHHSVENGKLSWNPDDYNILVSNCSHVCRTAPSTSDDYLPVVSALTPKITPDVSRKESTNSPKHSRRSGSSNHSGTKSTTTLTSSKVISSKTESPRHGSSPRIGHIDKENVIPTSLAIIPNKQKTVNQQLPRCRMTFDKEPAEIAIEFAISLLHLDPTTAHKCRRALPVSLWHSEPSTPRQPTESNITGFSSALFCIPVLEEEMAACGIDKSRYQFRPLPDVLDMCSSANSVFDVETRFLVQRLDEWLQSRSDRQPLFLHSLFLVSSAATRVGNCCHNPAFADEVQVCHRVKSSARCQFSDGQESELSDEVRNANKALAFMIEVEKCDVFAMNPLFGSGLPYRVGHGVQLVQYFARGRPEPLCRVVSATQSSNESSDSGSWIDDYPLHKYSYTGNAAAIQGFLKQGYDPNQLDRDSWAPIHYASWYGQLAAVQILVNIGNCSVNIRNRNDSTPLHFAAWSGHHYVAELLLSHPDIDIDAKDKDGKTALDLCECVPKTEWQAVAKLIKSAIKIAKIQVDLMDETNVMVPLIHGPDTTAAQLHHQLCRELKIKESLESLFSIWICSESLQLQLKAEHKPVRHMEGWRTKVLANFSDCANPALEEPKLVFRRNAHLSVVEEKKLIAAIQSADSSDVAVTLLYHEAQKNFVHGLYPCSEQDSIMLAATVMQIIHGNFDAKKDKQYLENERNVAKLIPETKLKMKNVSWGSKILQEHKQVSKMGVKNISNLQSNFLAFCWNLRVYGSAFFDGLVFVNKGTVKGNIRVHVGVNDFGLHMIHYETKGMFKSCAYKNLDWTWNNNRPYLDIKVKEAPIESFTLRSPQASLINTLLTKLSGQPITTRQVTAVSAQRLTSKQ